MRKGRGKYKRNERLGFNVTLRRWSGKKKKWLGHVMEKKDPNRKSDLEEKQPRNPKVLITNMDRMGSVENNTEIEIDSLQSNILQQQQGQNVIRRKDIHGIKQSQKTGRKGRYGGIAGETVKEGRTEQRKIYKKWKQGEDRGYRNGLLRSEVSEIDIESLSNEKKQEAEVHRRSKIEIRADVRRWRSGRVTTLQIGRDLIEHGKVFYINVEESDLDKKVKWQGDQLEVGIGRKVEEEVWKTRKGKRRVHMKKEENHVTGTTYREVDYVTGMRVVLRYPESNEVAIPDGRNVKLQAYM